MNNKGDIVNLYFLI